MKELIVFDLDTALVPRKWSLAPSTAGLLRDLLGVVKVGIISRATWDQVEKRLLTGLPTDSLLANLSLLPTCGTRFFQYIGTWDELYSEDLTAAQKEKIIDCLQTAADVAGYRAGKIWGTRIEDRGSQITFSALGQQAPFEEKEMWDPDFAKRKKISAILEKLIPEFSIHIGGATSIDVTRLGIDKAYGLRKLLDNLHLSSKEMVYVGDGLFPGGDDYPAKAAGVVSIPVKGPAESIVVIKTILALFGDK